MSDLGNALVKLVTNMEKQREAAHKAPYAVTMRELYASIEEELLALAASGDIRIGRTINDRYITTKTEKNG